MTSHQNAQPMHYGVFDIESVLDEAAAAVAGYKGGRIKPTLQKITTASFLKVTELGDGTWRSFELTTLVADGSEFDLLLDLDGWLEQLRGRHGTLVTYNGHDHDLACLRRRAARHWLFSLPGIMAASTIRHVDLLLRQRTGRGEPLPSLREALAALGISAFDVRGSKSVGLAADIIKCETDVVGTFLLLLYDIAMERGSPDPLLKGWSALAEYLAKRQPRAIHLEHFRKHPLLVAALKAT